MARDRVEVFKRKELKNLGKWGARTPLVQEVTIIESPSSLAKELASGEVKASDICVASWEKAQVAIFARTLAKLSSDINLKRQVAVAMEKHPHKEHAVGILLAQENAENKILYLVDHPDDSFVFNEIVSMGQETDSYIASLLADYLIEMAPLCNRGRADLFISTASSLQKKIGN
jgi:hypothetical protein